MIFQNSFFDIYSFLGKEGGIKNIRVQMLVLKYIK